MAIPGRTAARRRHQRVTDRVPFRQRHLSTRAWASRRRAAVADAPSAPPSPAQLCIRLDAGCRCRWFRTRLEASAPPPCGAAARARRRRTASCRSRRAAAGRRGRSRWQTRRPPPRGPGPDAAQVIGTQGAAPRGPPRSTGAGEDPPGAIGGVREPNARQPPPSRPPDRARRS